MDRVKQDGEGATAPRTEGQARRVGGVGVPADRPRSTSSAYQPKVLQFVGRERRADDLAKIGKKHYDLSCREVEG